MNDSEIISTLKKYQRDMKTCTMLIFILYFVIFVFGLKTIFDFITGKLWVISLIINIAAVVALKPIDKKRIRAKKEKKEFIGEHIVKRTISDVINIEEYAPNKHIEGNVVKASPIMPEFDSISGSDYIRGTYRGVNMTYSDVTLYKKERYRDTDGRTRTVDSLVFKGHFLRLNLNSQIDGYVKILERETPRKQGMFNDIVNTAKSLAGKSENMVEVESVAFNNQFAIYSDNDELVFYILTPHFMESIVKADEFARGTTNIYFNKTYVDIALDNRQDAFEVRNIVGDQRSLDMARQYIRNDLYKVIAIVDQIMTKDRLFS